MSSENVVVEEVHTRSHYCYSCAAVYEGAETVQKRVSIQYEGPLEDFCVEDFEVRAVRFAECGCTDEDSSITILRTGDVFYRCTADGLEWLDVDEAAECCN